METMESQVDKLSKGYKRPVSMPGTALSTARGAGKTKCHHSAKHTMCSSPPIDLLASSASTKKRFKKKKKRVFILYFGGVTSTSLAPQTDVWETPCPNRWKAPYSHKFLKWSIVTEKMCRLLTINIINKKYKKRVYGEQ